MSQTVPTLTLSNGKSMPIIGLGTYARKSSPGQFRQAVEWALEAGYRHIDTASVYKNEEEVGAAIQKFIQNGALPRDKLFVTTKLWSDRHAENEVVPTLKESLSRLQLDYVDLYLMHWPVSIDKDGGEANIDYLTTWKAMEQTVKLGLAKSIGVSNFNELQLSRLYDAATIKPVVNQFEINPTMTQHKLVDHCKRISVLPVAYTPLGLISEARPEFIGLDKIKTDPKLGQIAEKYNKTRAQIALRYLIQRGIPVLPKSFTKSRIQENLDIFDFALTQDDMDIVESYNINHRCVPAPAFKNLNNYPF